MDAKEMKPIDRLVREGLAEGYRMAAEARGTQRSKYQDAVALVGLLGMIVWLFILFLFLGPLYSLFDSGIEAALIASALTFIVVAPVLLKVRTSYRRRIDEQDRWMARLFNAMGPNAGKGDWSLFDLLVEVSQQVPVWLSIRKRDVFNRHPFLTTATFIAGSAVAYLTVLMMSLPSSEAIGYLVIMLVAFSLALVAPLYLIRTTDRRERDEALERWRERMDASRRAMEEMLGGL